MQTDASDAIEDETIVTFGGDDYVEIGAGTDDVDTGDGDDRVLDYGGSGSDTVRLGAQNDIVAAQSQSADGSDVYDGGRGRDRVVYRARTIPVTADLTGTTPGLTPEDALTALEEVYGSATAANTLIGNGAKNDLRGGTAADVLDGGTNDDWLEGDRGDDRLMPGQGADVLLAGPGDDEIDARDGVREALFDCDNLDADVALADQFDQPSECESTSVTETAVPTVFAGLTLDTPADYDRTFSTAQFPTELTPHVVYVETPQTGGEGSVSITTGSATNVASAGATFQGPQFEIATQGIGAPLRITFWIDYSARLQGPAAVFRDGVLLPSCTGATALPAGVAACVTGVVPHSLTNTGFWKPMEIVVLADHAGSWNLGWYQTPSDAGGDDDDGVTGGGGPLLPVPPTPIPRDSGSGATADTTGPVIPGTSTAPVTTVRGNRFAFAVGPFSEPVTGTIALVSNAIRYRGKQARIRLPALPFAAAPGKRVKVAFRLTRKQSRLLAKARKVKMTATVTARDVRGNATSRKFSFQLKAPRKSG
jgi:Ca2+-binding RTX toxin-like protein